MKSSVAMKNTNSQRNTRRLIELRGLNEYAFCPRLYHMMYVQNVFVPSADTITGAAEHERGRSRKIESKRPDPFWPDAKEMTLTAEDVGLVGKFDALREENGRWTPIEDKHSKAPDDCQVFSLSGRTFLSIWINDAAQLVGQMCLLRSNGYVCSEGKIYYRGNKTTRTVEWHEDYIQWLEELAESARRLHESPIPEPYLDSQKCVRCSLNSICLPDEYWNLRGKLDEPRKLHPGREDRAVLYCTTPGTTISKRGEMLETWSPMGEKSKVHRKDVRHVALFGNSQISTQAMLEVVKDQGLISYHSISGTLKAITQSPASKNIYLREKQFVRLQDDETRLQLARSIVFAKIQNQRTLIRRNAVNAKNELSRFQRLAKKATDAKSRDELLGIEGSAGRLYWEEFGKLIAARSDCFAMNGRNRRPPKDPVNAMLSFGYSMLTRDWIAAIMTTGLDPYYGFYHSMGAGRPALSLDLMESYRPLIVDSVVLRCVSEKRFAAEDFACIEGFCAFHKSAKKKWLEAYEQRIQQLITHPVFDYRLSYRRVLALEARLFARFLEGELGEYLPMRTR